MVSPIIVLCGHSSGSTAIAGVMHHLGVDMGASHFLPPSQDKSQGYYEDARFVSLNRAILRQAGGAWNKLVLPKSIMAVQDQFAGPIEALLQWRQGESEGKEWGWKDPQMVQTMPLYAPFLDNPRFVVVPRDNYCAAQSLASRKHDQMHIDDALPFIRGHNLRMMALIGGLRRSVPVHYIHYDDLIDDTATEVYKLAMFLEMFDSAISFVDPDLRHY